MPSCYVMLSFLDTFIRSEFDFFINHKLYPQINIMMGALKKCLNKIPLTTIHHPV